jgi:Domain of unknown function (DUF4902)
VSRSHNWDGLLKSEHETLFRFATFENPSREGYVRFSQQALSHLRLVHVESRLDDDSLHKLRAENVDALKAGYTEWQRIHEPGAAYVSVGWDWYLERESGVLLIACGTFAATSCASMPKLISRP